MPPWRPGVPRSGSTVLAGYRKTLATAASDPLVAIGGLVAALLTLERLARRCSLLLRQSRFGLARLATRQFSDTLLEKPVGHPGSIMFADTTTSRTNV